MRRVAYIQYLPPPPPPPREIAQVELLSRAEIYTKEASETGRKGESAGNDLKELDTLCVQGKQGGVGTVLTELWNNFLLEAGF